jgi:hypothetical protein
MSNFVSLRPGRIRLHEEGHPNIASRAVAVYPGQGRSLVQNGAREAVLSMAGTVPPRAGTLNRDFFWTGLMGYTTTYDAGDGGLLSPNFPLAMDTHPIQALPSIWLQQTENRLLRDLPPTPLLARALGLRNAISTAPPNFVHFRSAAQYAGPMNVAGPANNALLAADTRLQGTFQGIMGQHPETVFSRFSDSFAAATFSGVDVHLQGILANLPAGYAVYSGQGARTKWTILTSTPEMKRTMKQYIRLVLNRYATFNVPRQADVTIGSITWSGNVEGAINVEEEPNIFSLFDSTQAIWHYFGSMRRVTGWWGNTFTSEGQEVIVNRNLSAIRKRILRVNVKAEGLNLPDFMDIVYDKLRTMSSLFTRDDQDVPYYAKINFYIEDNDAEDNDLPAEILCPFIRDHGPGEAPRSHIKSRIREIITGVLQSDGGNANFTDYVLWAEFIWINDPNLQNIVANYIAPPQPAVLPVAPDEDNARFGEDEDPLPAPMNREERRYQDPRASRLRDIQQRITQRSNARSVSSSSSSSSFSAATLAAPAPGPVVSAVAGPLINAPVSGEFATKTNRQKKPRVAQAREGLRSGTKTTRSGTKYSFTRSKLKGYGGAHNAMSHQEKMFLKGSMMRRFSEEKSLFLSPDRPHQTCMIMSLFRAERTIYEFHGFQLKSIHKSSVTATLGEYEILLPVVNTEVSGIMQRQMPFYTEMDGTAYWRLSVAGKYRNLAENRESTDKFLPGAKDKEEIGIWELAAEEMCAFMEHTGKKDLDINSIDEICQAFADTFHILVSVYDLECRGTRIQVYTPEQKVVRQLLQPGEPYRMQMIHIVMDSGHCHAISNIQAFLSSQHRNRAIGVYQHCPFCDGRTTRALENFEKAKEHISDCARNTCDFTSRAEEAFHANLVGSPEEVRLCFRKNAPSFYQCITCKKEVSQQTYLDHVCTLVAKTKEEKPIPNDKIFVYDLESAQVMTPSGVKEHQCNCVVVQAVYGDPDVWQHYESEVEFVQALISPTSVYKESTFLAHNGGGYDCQFLLRVLERWEIEHTFTPSPGSQHKFLQIHLVENKVTLLDFMRFVPGSLKGIAQAFNCPLSKGDFPHQFNDGTHMQYSGALPPNNPLAEDYWCQRHSKSAGASREFQEWYDQEARQEYCTCWSLPHCECSRKPWIFKDELIRYCALDVKVLSKVVKAYREEMLSLYRDCETAEEQNSSTASVEWAPVQLDPFRCMTIAQICIRMLAQGYKEEKHRITTLHQRNRGGLNPLSLAWMDRRSADLGETIIHRGNWIREYYQFYLKIHMDGYAPESDTVFWFIDCSYWGCPKCCPPEWEEAIHPERQVRYSDIAAQYQFIYETLHRQHRHVEVLWEHDYAAQFTAPSAQETISNQLFHFDEAFYGGRTEVFQPYAKFFSDPIEHHDVTSLYPSTYLEELPIGVPVHLRSWEIDKDRLHPTASNRYFGFAKVFVIPRRSDLIGLLPQRDKENGRLCFPVFPMTGVWGTQELYLAMQNGYEVVEIYEVYHWSPENRSKDYLKGYVSTYIRMKQEADGWKKLGAQTDDPSDEEKERLIQELYHQNGNLGRIRKEKVQKNPVKRQLAKLFLNSLWGKFAQKESHYETMTIYGPAQFSYIWSHCAILKESFTFRETSPGTYKVRFQFRSAFVRHVGHGNTLLAARITEAGRCVLHSRMLTIGPERIIYCDTDSIVFYRDRMGPELEGVGLGQWVNEYPDEVIEEFAALAPKMYTVVLSSGRQGNQIERENVKAKGVMLSCRNKAELKISRMKELLLPIVRGDKEHLLGAIQLENMSIYTNCQSMSFDYATMLTRENTKDVRVVISKRQVVVHEDFDYSCNMSIRTLPWGFNEAD